MRIIIVGCGRVGAQTAAELDQRGEHVTVIDIDQRAFNRLPSTFGGVTVRVSRPSRSSERSVWVSIFWLTPARRRDSSE